MNAQGFADFGEFVIDMRRVSRTVVLPWHRLRLAAKAGTVDLRSLLGDVPEHFALKSTKVYPGGLVVECQASTA